MTTRDRTLADEQDLVLLVLLALDGTGHGLGPGSVPDLADMASHEAIKSLHDAGFARSNKDSALVLTDNGRHAAREVARRMSGGAA